MFRRLFQAHPASVGETYLEHMVHAAYFGSRMLLAGLACLIHALIPRLAGEPHRGRGRVAVGSGKD